MIDRGAHKELEERGFVVVEGFLDEVELESLQRVGVEYGQL